MINNDSKMPVVLIGNSFKYEVEATLKLFFSTARYSFSDNISDACGEKYVIAKVETSDNCIISAEIKNSDEPETDSVCLPADSDKNTVEHELCRLIYHILCRKTGIRPPWGLMTGIRPVKKVTELMEQELSEEQIRSLLTKRFELSPDKFDLAYKTAVNQLPILHSIDSSAVSLYVSIPFCPTRCSYCSFVSHSMDSAIKLMPEYISSLCRELEMIGNIVKENNTKIDTIYFGGGTPTSISADDLRRIMEAVETNFDLANVREYSVEAGRPDTITEEKLRVIKSLGASRISVNPQTLNDDVLKVIGRKHSGEDAVKAFELARKIGFDNINVDLMIGLPNQKISDVKNSLEKIINLKPNSPEHISVYSLIVEENTPIEKMINGGNLKLPDEKTERNMYWYVKNFLELNGYKHYEISNFAKEGYESKHNLDCWNQKEYIGFGVAAHSYINDVRFGNISNIEKYINNCENNEFEKNKIIDEVEEDIFSKEQEYMLIGLRKIDGISIQEFKNKFGDNPIFVFKNELSKLVDDGLIIVDFDNIKLTNKGLDLANLVWEEFV